MEEKFLTWALTGDGIMAVAGWISSYLLEPWPAWGALPAARKRIYVMALMVVVLPGLFLALSCLLGLLPFDQHTVFLALQAGFVGFMTSQAAHLPALGKADTAKQAGVELVAAYRNALGPIASAASSDSAQRFAYRAQIIAERALGLDKRATSL